MRSVGHPTFSSPHAKPIAIAGGFVYVANTPADTVDVIDPVSARVVHRIDVGIDPVGIAVRPDGREVWVANHVSDSVSVIDANPASRTFHHVVATVQDIDPARRATRFDEPVGIAFASDAKAYVALGPDNRIAIVDVAARAVVGHLPIRAQDPRAIAVRGGRLYAIAFESNNQTQLSGCVSESIDGDRCTFDAVEHVFRNNNVLSLNYDADIVKNPDVADRDLFVFDTATDEPVAVVAGVGTLLYDLAVDGAGRVFVAQTDARNDANGRAGTRGHGLAEMENRAFLNQITRIDCAEACGAPQFFDLEPRPPQHPAPGRALATPFGIVVSEDDATVVATAAGSDQLFTMDAETGTVLGRVGVGAVPRGIALESDSLGAPRRAWVLNAVANTVSRVDLRSLARPRVTATIVLDDPTHPDVKRGRIAFHDADASSTGTFSCDSCHPDGHTDQLVWVLDTPICDVDGCTQIPPRVTMPARGLRDTQPYHWDGIPGDPYGGINTASTQAPVAPNCDVDAPEGCTRHLVDGSMATTMCDVTDCPTNDEGKPGRLDAEDRDALARFLLSIPYPPAPKRAFDNALSAEARSGFFEFSFIADTSSPNTGTQTCGDCHKMPYLTSTNTPGSGMDAPTWRGAYDRWVLLPQGRLNVIDLMEIVSMEAHFPERDMWILTGASAEIWEMVLQGSTGFSGAFGRQLTLSPETHALPQTLALLDALEAAAAQGAVRLEAEGVWFQDDARRPLALEFVDGVYRPRLVRADAEHRDGAHYRQALLAAAGAGELVLTLTGRAGINVDVDSPQPGLWPRGRIEAQTRKVEIAHLDETLRLRVSGRHVQPGAGIYLNGRRVGGEIRCETGSLPDCEDESLVIRLASAPAAGGVHFLQVQNPAGLFSNDMMFFSERGPMPPRPGNLIDSGGAFTAGQFGDQWNTVEIAANSISERAGEVYVDVSEASDDPWHVQLSHSVMVIEDQQYSLCYQARARGSRFIEAYVDSNKHDWRNIGGGRFRADLSWGPRRFHHTFTARETDLQGRVAFDFAQSSHDVWLDNVGLYEGPECGSP